MKNAAPVAKILTIGDELLKGSVLNTNAQFLGRELLSLGFYTRTQTACPDDRRLIRRAFSDAFASSDLVVLTGGLGPTPDDQTRDALSDYFRVPLILSKKQWSFIEGYYKRRKRKAPTLVKKEALFPANAEPLFNRWGIALGFTITEGAKMAVVLPGVPSELENMFHELVRPRILKVFGRLRKKYPVIVKTAGIGEPEVMKKLGPGFFSDPFDFGIYPGAGEVALRLYAGSAAVARRLAQKAKRGLEPWIYAWEEITLAEAVGRLLARKKKTLAVAESCTGGILSAEISAIAGASRYFKGGIVAYHNEVKENFLGVRRGTLSAYGAVSKQAALEMAAGARESLQTDFAVSVTGIAGPDGGSKAKPVGQVWIGIAGPKGVKAEVHHFYGNRRQVQTKAAKKALEGLWRLLR